jgi:hypothetical protein
MQRGMGGGIARVPQEKTTVAMQGPVREGADAIMPQSE